MPPASVSACFGQRRSPDINLENTKLGIFCAHLIGQGLARATCRLLGHKLIHQWPSVVFTSVHLEIRLPSQEIGVSSKGIPGESGAPGVRACVPVLDAPNRSTAAVLQTVASLRQRSGTGSQIYKVVAKQKEGAMPITNTSERLGPGNLFADKTAGKTTEKIRILM